jgi:hypothetical protein
MRKTLLGLFLALPLLTACEPAPAGVDGQALLDSVGAAIGDPNTCVLLVEQGTAKTVFRYGEPSRCLRSLPDCGPAGGQTTAEALAKLAARGDDRAISCDSVADGSRRVGWATGPFVATPGSKYEPLAYAAMMEGEGALPGREIKARLEPALRKGGM